MIVNFVRFFISSIVNLFTGFPVAVSGFVSACLLATVIIAVKRIFFK